MGRNLLCGRSRVTVALGLQFLITRGHRKVIRGVVVESAGVPASIVWKCELAKIQSMRGPPDHPVKKWNVPSLRVATGWATRKTSCGKDPVGDGSASSVR